MTLKTLNIYDGAIKLRNLTINRELVRFMGMSNVDRPHHEL